MSVDVIRQDLSGDSGGYRMPMAQLLFSENPKKLNIKQLKADFEKLVGDTDIISDGSDKGGMCALAAKNYKVVFEERPEGVPAFAAFLNPIEFKSDNLGELELSQLWDVPDGRQLLENARYAVNVLPMMSMNLEYKKLAELFLAQVEAALNQYPDCIGIYVVSAGKLTTRNDFYETKKYNLGARFLRLAVNARFFNIQGSNDMLVDTLGLTSLGMAEIQLHFHDMTPNDIVNYAYNIASYQFDYDFPIKDDDPVVGLDKDGKLSRDVLWSARYEDALIQPPRVVLDINCGGFAAGRRN